MTLTLQQTQLYPTPQLYSTPGSSSEGPPTATTRVGAGREVRIWCPRAVPGVLHSTHQASYPAFRFQDPPPQSCRRVDTVGSGTTFPLGSTTSSDSFVAHPVQRLPEPVRPRNSWNFNDGFSRDFTTTNQDSFKRLPLGVRATAIRPQQSPVSEGGFTSLPSTYSDSYTGQPLPQVVPCKPAHSLLELSAAYFGALSSTSRESYGAPGPTQRVKAIEVQRLTTNAATPFSGSTESQTAFRSYKLAAALTWALGIEVAGGTFYSLLPLGTRPPAQASALLTTMLDGQRATDIVIVARSFDGRAAVELGCISMVGDARAGAGEPRFKLSMQLQDGGMVRVVVQDESLPGRMGVWSGLTPQAV